MLLSFFSLIHATAHLAVAAYPPAARCLFQFQNLFIFFEYLAITHGMQGFFCLAPHPCRDTHRTAQPPPHKEHQPAASRPARFAWRPPRRPLPPDRAAPAGTWRFRSYAALPPASVRRARLQTIRRAAPCRIVAASADAVRRSSRLPPPPNKSAQNAPDAKPDGLPQQSATVAAQTRLRHPLSHRRNRRIWQQRPIVRAGSHRRQSLITAGFVHTRHSLWQNMHRPRTSALASACDSD